MKTTEKYGFSMPELEDAANVEALSKNWDKSEGELGDFDARLESLKTEINQVANSITPITYGTEDLTAGTSELATGSLYFVYE